MQDEKRPARFIFIETFTDTAVHEATRAQMPKEILSALMPTLDGPPDGSTYSFIAKL